ncbi:hypothetical protein ACH5RR_012638 [Cinchona calisaya]|uniref:Uncharacterized protein n=1 Tax=Cinchona calisaya TaxID=153742 RepID=A0ABD3A8D0_9GENT
MVPSIIVVDYAVIEALAQNTHLEDETFKLAYGRASRNNNIIGGVLREVGRLNVVGECEKNASNGRGIRIKSSVSGLEPVRGCIINRTEASIGGIIEETSSIPECPCIAGGRLEDVLILSTLAYPTLKGYASGVEQSIEAVRWRTYHR